jgi:heme/copper-type cytochrome/quinol oxidase subunit 2
VADLGLNVPICAMCQTSFTFFSGAPGTFTWRCMDPCGTGPSGWDGAMATDGYMSGHITVV